MLRTGHPTMASMVLPATPLRQNVAGDAPLTPTAKSAERWLVSVLKSPQSPARLRALHGQVVKTGHARNDLVVGQLLLCCSISGSMDDALSVFLSLSASKTFFCNTILKGYADNAAYGECLGFYARMRSIAAPCDSFTFPAVLRAAGCLGRTDVGEEAHGLALKMGLGGEVIVQTAVMGMYASCGSTDRARFLFDRMDERDVVCWNTMVAGYVKSEEFDRASQLFDQTPERNVASWNCIVNMYCKMGKMEVARNLFEKMPKRDIISWNAMISGYSRTADPVEARRLFELMPERNVVSWNAVITCCMHHSLFQDAISLFRRMQSSGVRPNEVTFVAILAACAHLGALDLGRWVESYIRRRHVKMDAYVTAALVDMYGNCGSLADARRIFDEAGRKDTFLCSTMIEVLAIHGKAYEAFEVFDSMRIEDIEPNDVTFVGLLKACSHAGLVEAGKCYFGMMNGVFGLTPKVEHYGCMVDLLGRAGLLHDAHKLILAMPMDPHPIVWATLLSSCRIHGDVDLAEKIATCLIDLEPESCGNYVLLSNAYSKANRWEDAAALRKMMKDKGISKKPGCSLIEVNNEVNEFVAGDSDHPQRKEIYSMLGQMAVRLKREGYVPRTSSALQEVDSDRKEEALLHHSEKLAVAFGLIRTGKDTTVRIVKNLRICEDCHIFMKLVSKHYGRQVIVRDRNRFHHFHNGSCSCSDYW